MELLQQSVMQLEVLMQRARWTDQPGQYFVLRNAQQLILTEILGAAQNGLIVEVAEHDKGKVRARAN